MKDILRIFILLIISTHVSQAQIIKGRITSKEGNPIQYATVYIQELKQGTTSNSSGDYELKISPGRYAVIYQSLGFVPEIISIDVPDKTITMDVELSVQYYEVPEVIITASGEDPAYGIMRKVIGMAPYYLNNVNYYKADVYLKGSLEIDKIPKLLQKSMKIEARRKSGSSAPETMIREGNTYIMESFNEIEFTAPEKYYQKVISYNSTFPEEGNDLSPMDFIKASFYQPVLVNVAISPLAPNAFSFYNYRYRGTSLQGNFTICKIEVIPKRKSQQVFAGTIYIIEDLWCLHSVDLTNENFVGKVRIEQLYIPVQDEIWMPVSHKFEINIGVMGLRANAGYGSSVKYLDVRPNTALQKPFSNISDYPARSGNTIKTDKNYVEKENEQIKNILEKDEMSNRDMVRLARLMDKVTEKSIDDSLSGNLEIKDYTTHVVEKDAREKDSAYWEAIRPIPLSEIEAKSLQINDSIKKVTALRLQNRDTLLSGIRREQKIFLHTVKDVVLGHTWYDTTGVSFTCSGLISPGHLSFNTVDGFVYGMGFRFSKTWKDNKYLALYPDIHWAFSREQLLWRINANYRFNGHKQSQIFIRAGITSKDISTGGGISPFLNSATTLLLRKNYLKLFESRYMTMGTRGELVNGLTLEVSAGYENRRVLENTTDYSLFRSSVIYTDNVPVNKYLNDGSNPINKPSDQRHGEFVAKVTYTPFQKFRMSKGNKIPMGSEWPTFNLTWKHGIDELPEVTERYNNYDMLRVEAFKNMNTGAFSEFRWRVRAGGYLNNTNLTFFDFFHFNTQTFPLLFSDNQDAFMLPAYYSLSTPEIYGEVHLKYTTPYLLIKLLPGISNTLMRENISFSSLSSRDHRNYFEIGYSISELFLIGEIGIHMGFEDIKYKSIGAKLVLILN